MGKKLKTWVYVGENRYGPDDDVPADVAKQITNPDVWADGDDGSVESTAAPGAGEDVTQRPPASGAGSGRDAWAAYAASQRVQVTDDMTRDDIIAAVDAKQ